MKQLISFLLLTIFLSSCSSQNDAQKPSEVENNQKWIACTMDYNPVCGKVNVQCIKAPCDPVQETFSNKCVAESRWAFDLVPWECK